MPGIVLVLAYLEAICFGAVFRSRRTLDEAALPPDCSAFICTFAEPPRVELRFFAGVNFAFGIPDLLESARFEVNALFGTEGRDGT